MTTNETPEQQAARLDKISAAIEALVAEHGPMLVAGAIQSYALGSLEYMQAAMRVSLMARDIVLQKRAEASELCQCPNCRALRAQA